jgi:hypothetical protein
MAEHYSTGELKQLFNGIKEDLGEIKDQTKKTNGRVSALENWRWFITGGLVIIGSLLVPILLSLI